MSISQKPRSDQAAAADKVAPIAPHRAARRSDSPDLLDALSAAMQAPQMMDQDDVLLGGLADDAAQRPAAAPAAAEETEDTAAEADPRQLDLLAKSA